MKTETQVHDSYTGALKHAISEAELIRLTIKQIQEDPEKHKAKMPKLRAALAELNQRIHEANAYHNTLTT